MFIASMIMKLLHQQFWQRLYILKWFLFSEGTVHTTQATKTIATLMIPAVDIVNILKGHEEGG